MRAVAFLVLAAGVAGAADDPKPAAIKIYHPRTTPSYVMVELYKDGKLVRTQEVSGSSGADSIYFRKLAAGAYEVHFTAPGYQKAVKRVVLPDDPENEPLLVRVEIERDKSVVTGGGVSLYQMADEIARLKAEVERLKAEVEKLKAK